MLTRDIAYIRGRGFDRLPDGVDAARLAAVASAPAEPAMKDLFGEVV
jgi:hypothetical protein